MSISEDFLIGKFLQHAGYPKYKSYNKVYEACCPICREGNSWGRKKRLYYLLEKEKICCHNCGWYGSPTNFIMEVTGSSYSELVQEADSFDTNSSTIVTKKKQEVKRSTFGSLPEDSINLFDKHQLKYHKNNVIVKKCLDVIENRQLLTAINKPKSLYVSLTDFTHKNRLVIPFFSIDGKIVFYQSRTILDEDNANYPKYLSKINAEKSIFGVNNITSAAPSIYIFEGPIDAFFCANGVAVAGIQKSGHVNLTQYQKDQLNSFYLFDKVWVLDSQWQDETSMSKTQSLIEAGEKVFIWPEEYGTRFKDFNDMAIGLDTNEIPHTFVDKHTYEGRAAEMELNKLKLTRR